MEAAANWKIPAAFLKSCRDENWECLFHPGMTLVNLNQSCSSPSSQRLLLANTMLLGFRLIWLMWGKKEPTSSGALLSSVLGYGKDSALPLYAGTRRAGYGPRHSSVLGPTLPHVCILALHKSFLPSLCLSAFPLIY